MARKRNNIMLAHPAEDKRIKRLGSTFIGQPKFKGVHNLASNLGDEPVFTSSTNLVKPFFSHLKEQLKVFPKLEFDGEIYKHGMSENEINSRASRTANPHPDEGSLEFHIFDIKLPGIIQKDRLDMLDALRFVASSTTHIKISPRAQLTQETWPVYLEYCMKNDYEGMMFRDPTGLYETKRSPNLLKLKPTETDIYKIVGFQQGTGWCHDRLGAFIVEDKHGNEFGVGSGSCMTADLRLQYWNTRGILLNTYLLVKHETLKTGKNNFPQCAVGVKPLNAQEVEAFRANKHNDLT